jgi:hypothetical protein
MRTLSSGYLTIVGRADGGGNSGGGLMMLNMRMRLVAIRSLRAGRGAAESVVVDKHENHHINEAS